MKKFEGILWLVFLSISGYIGFATNNVSTINASVTPVIPRFTDVPHNNKGFNLNIDLNSDKVIVDDAENITVKIQKKDSIIYVPSIVEKPYYVRVSEMPPVREPKVKVTGFTKGCFSLEKINLVRQ